MQKIDPMGIPEFKKTFCMHPGFWEDIDAEVAKAVSSPDDWSEAKLLNRKGDKHSQLRKIPNDMGGIYLLYVKPDIVPEVHRYLMYIGRAQKTAGQNLRKRCLEYPTETDRPKIVSLIEQWGQHICVRFLPLDDNNLIDKIEKELINIILPPCNDRIPDKKKQAAVKAFG